MKLILVFIAFSIFEVHSQELVFNSGFEPGTVITDPLDANYSDLIGVDSSYSSPNDWVGDLDQHPDIGGFRYQYSGGDTSKRFIKLVPDPTDSSNTVMQFWMKHANDPIGNTGLFKGRIQASLYGCTNLHNFSQSVRMYLSDDWNILKNTDDFTMNWMTILEFWNDGGWTNSPFPFRASLGIIKNDSSGTDLTFKVHFDTLQVSINKWIKMYTEIDSSFSIPTEKWMTLEYYYEEGDENNGKFIFAVRPDGEPKQVIFDITYHTRHPLDMNPNGLHALNPMKMYTHSRNIDTVRNNGGVLQMYWDDFKFWKDTNIVEKALCGELIYDGSFSSSNQFWSSSSSFTSYGNGHTGCLPRTTSLEVVNDSVYGEVAKFTLIDNDFCSSGSDRERAQLKYISTNIGANLEYDDVWISWSMKLDDSWTDTTTWCGFSFFSSPNFWQSVGVHGEFGLSFSSPASSFFTGGRTLLYRYNTNYGTAPSSSYSQPFPNDISLGKWHDMLMHVKFSRDSTGFLEYYYKTEDDSDYQLIVSEYNTVTQMTIPGFPNDVIGFTLGLYRGAVATDTSIVYYKGYKIGLNRSNVIDNIDRKTACTSYTWIDGNTYTSSNNSATHTLTNSVGCDSVVTLNLTITNIDTTTTTNDITIAANQNGALYQWIDCDNGNTPITGETGQSFTAPANGNYAVEVTFNSCMDTSACEIISSVGIEDLSLDNIIISQQENTVVITHDLPNILEVIVYDITGKVIHQKVGVNASPYIFELSAAKQIVFVQVVSVRGVKTRKIIY